MEKAKIKLMPTVLTGAVTGAVNGFFGAGGGMVLIPLLTGLLKVDERRAFASSVFIIALMSCVSFAVYLLRGASSVADAVPFLIGGLIGGTVGGKIFKKVPVNILRKSFAALMIYGGIKNLI